MMIQRYAQQLIMVCCALAAACSSSYEVGSISQLLCNCDQDPRPCCCTSPVLLDVAGDGFRLTSLDKGVVVSTRPGVQATQRAWTPTDDDDAWLVYDRDKNGSIDDMSEMFGSTTPQPDPPAGQERNGFLALAQYDMNADGIIDSNDSIFDELRLWQDKNHDGRSQLGELHALADLGVAGLSVHPTTAARRPDGQGNVFGYEAMVYRTPGSTVSAEAWDVWLAGVQPAPAPYATAGVDAADEACDPQPTARWRCDASCNVQQIDPNAQCPDRVTGTGTGTSSRAACSAAERDANSKVPNGCYKRHCHCDCTKGSETATYDDDFVMTITHE